MVERSLTRKDKFRLADIQSSCHAIGRLLIIRFSMGDISDSDLEDIEHLANSIKRTTELMRKEVEK